MTVGRAVVPPSFNDDDLVRILVERLVDGFDPERILLFGSRARGTARLDSDVDVLVVMPDGTQRSEAQVAMRRVLRDLRTPKDIIVTTPEEIGRRGAIPGLVLNTALGEGIELYARA